MKKTLIILSFVTILASCGSNKKTSSNQVTKNKTDRSCTKTRTIGSNMPTINCNSSQERKEQRNKSKESSSLGK